MTYKKLFMMVWSVAFAFAASADTYTDAKGVTWTYTEHDAQNHYVTFVNGSGGNAVACVPDPDNLVMDYADIPWTFKKDDITYTVKIITNRAFLNCKKMYGTLRIPSSVARVKGGYTFADNKVLTNLIVAASVPIEGDHLFKGCNSIQTARIGNQVSTRGLFNACNSMKLVLFGPNAVRTTTDDTGSYESFVNAVCSNCKVFCPAGSSWDSYAPGGQGVEKVRYGAEYDLNIEVDETAKILTATVASTNALAAVLDSAPYFKSGFGLDTRINVTNALDIADGLITPGKLANATFNTLMVSVKTQAQLDSLLAVVPASIPLSIDPTGATQKLTISTADGRKVYVLLPENGTYKIRKDGLVILVN